MQITTGWANGLDIEVRGEDVVSHTGTVIARMLADWTGLTRELSGALARPDVIHDRGRVLADLSLAIADGATSISDIDAVIGIRIDATLIDSHSDKQQAAGNFKGGYGFHPLTAWCDNTGECLAIIARSGNAESNTAGDHIARKEPTSPGQWNPASPRTTGGDTRHPPTPNHPTRTLSPKPPPVKNRGRCTAMPATRTSS